MSGFLDEPRDPAALRLFRYWQSKRRGRLFPGRRDLDPVEFPYALGNIVLVEVLEGPRFRYRLFGSNVAFRNGFDLTGQVLDDRPPAEYRDFVLGLYRTVLAERKPLFPAGQWVLDGRLLSYEGALLPLAADGTAIDMLLTYVGYTEPGEG